MPFLQPPATSIRLGKGLRTNFVEPGFNPHYKLIRITTVPSSLKVLLKRQLHYMSNYFDVLAVSSPGKHLEEVNVNECVRTVAIPLTRFITPLRDIRALWLLFRLFKNEKPQIVHSHTPKAGLLGMLAAKMAGVPVRMHTVAGLPLVVTRGWKRRLLMLTEYITYSCASKVYPNSEKLGEFILDKKLCPPGKLKVLGYGSSNGIDTNYFRLHQQVAAAAIEARHRLKIIAGEFVFVFIGRLVRDKGIEELVEAFCALRQKHENIRLLLVGVFEQDQDPVSPAIFQEIHNNPAIIRLDFQEDIRPYLAISHVLAFPSYREGFPNVPMQAGCFNLPSIVTDINGCNEIIEHNKNGLIIPVRDVTALRDAMEKLLTHPLLYDRLKANARSMITDRYEQKYVWSLLLAEYYELLANHVVQPLSEKIA